MSDQLRSDIQKTCGSPCAPAELYVLDGFVCSKSCSSHLKQLASLAPAQVNCSSQTCEQMNQRSAFVDTAQIVICTDCSDPDFTAVVSSYPTRVQCQTKCDAFYLLYGNICFVNAQDSCSGLYSRTNAKSIPIAKVVY